MNDVDARVAARMAGQHSLVTRHQALGLGMTPRQIEWRLARRLWVPSQRGVYRPASVRPSFEQEVMAACLAVDGYASHRCAAALFRLRGFPTGPVEVTVTGDCRHRLHSAIRHRCSALTRRDVVTMDSIPITTPAMTLLGLAATAPDRLEQALNDALCRGLTHPERIRSALCRAAGPNRKGAVLLAELLDRVAAPTESYLEDDFVALVRRHGLPEPVRQYPIAGGRYRLDFTWPPSPHAVETHGRRWHLAPEDRRANRAKRQAALAEGFVIHDLYWEDVHEWGAETAARLAGLVRQAP